MLTFFSLNFSLAIFILLTSLILLFGFYKRKVNFSGLLFIMFVTLSFFQIRWIDVKKVYSFNPSELDLQIQRMNYYPPKLARMGYILERKKEIQLIKILEKNFFEVLDINTYFPNYYSYLTLPFFLYGLYIFIKDSDNPQRVLITFSFLLTTILGIHGKYGPFILFPFINLFIFIAIVKLIRLKKN